MSEHALPSSSHQADPKSGAWFCLLRRHGRVSISGPRYHRSTKLARTMTTTGVLAGDTVNYRSSTKAQSNSHEHEVAQTPAAVVEIATAVRVLRHHKAHCLVLGDGASSVMLVSGNHALGNAKSHSHSCILGYAAKCVDGKALGGLRCWAESRVRMPKSSAAAQLNFF